MVAVLLDQLAELLLGVGRQRGGRCVVPGLGHGPHYRDFVPQDQSVAIGEVVHGLAVLIVRRANRVHAHVEHQRNVLSHVGVRLRPPLAFSALVVRDAVKGQVSSVEDRPRCGSIMIWRTP